MPLPSLKKVVKTRKGIAALIVGVTWFFWAVGMIGDFETIIGIRPYLHYSAVVPTYGVIIGAWVGAHFASIVAVGVCVGLFTWAARDVARQEHEGPSPNMILASTTFFYVAKGDPPYNWEHATLRSVDSEVGLIARFTNRAKAVPVGAANSVRADIVFENREGNHVTSFPAPWLYCSNPVIPFAVGATHELLIALDVIELPQTPMPASMAQGPHQNPPAVLRTVEDVADRVSDIPARYNYHRGLSGPVKATVHLTVNGLAIPPYELMLQPSNRNVIPPTPPIIRPVHKPTLWQRVRQLVSSTGAGYV